MDKTKNNSKQWHKVEAVRGLRYYESLARKNGVVRKDRCYQARFKVDGKLHEEILGWESDGVRLEDAITRLKELRDNAHTGVGPSSLREQRRIADEKRQAEEIARRKAEELAFRESLTFNQFFEGEYLPAIEGIRKPDSVRKAREHVNNWLGPVLKDMPLLKIRSVHLEKVRADLVSAGRSPRTQEYVMATFRAVWNKARNRGLVQGESPTRAVELPRVSNTRQRYLKPSEADNLLTALQSKSLQTYQIALLSLHTGLRFGECTALVWGCIDLEKRVIQVLNAKGDKDRTVYMTEDVYALFQGMPKGLHNEVVFKSRKGGKIFHIAKAFDEAVAEVGLNEHVSDSKLRFTFHGLRHTHASWLIERGVGLYVVQKQLGHSSPVVTQRYSHVSDDMLKNATKAFEQGISKKKGRKVVRLADRG